MGWYLRRKSYCQKLWMGKEAKPVAAGPRRPLYRPVVGGFHRTGRLPQLTHHFR